MNFFNSHIKNFFTNGNEPLSPNGNLKDNGISAVKTAFIVDSNSVCSTAHFPEGKIVPKDDFHFGDKSSYIRQNRLFLSSELNNTEERIMKKCNFNNSSSSASKLNDPFLTHNSIVYDMLGTPENKNWQIEVTNQKFDVYYDSSDDSVCSFKTAASDFEIEEYESDRKNSFKLFTNKLKEEVKFENNAYRYNYFNEDNFEKSAEERIEFEGISNSPQYRTLDPLFGYLLDTKTEFQIELPNTEQVLGKRKISPSHENSCDTVYKKRRHTISQFVPESTNKQDDGNSVSGCFNYNLTTFAKCSQKAKKDKDFGKKMLLRNKTINNTDINFDPKTIINISKSLSLKNYFTPATNILTCRFLSLNLKYQSLPIEKTMPDKFYTTDIEEENELTKMHSKYFGTTPKLLNMNKCITSSLVKEKSPRNKMIDNKLNQSNVLYTSLIDKNQKGLVQEKESTILSPFSCKFFLSTTPDNFLSKIRGDNYDNVFQTNLQSGVGGSEVIHCTSGENGTSRNEINSSRIEKMADNLVFDESTDKNDKQVPLESPIANNSKIYLDFTKEQDLFSKDLVLFSKEINFSKNLMDIIEKTNNCDKSEIKIDDKATEPTFQCLNEVLNGTKSNKSHYNRDILSWSSHKKILQSENKIANKNDFVHKMSLNPTISNMVLQKPNSDQELKKYNLKSDADLKHLSKCDDLNTFINNWMKSSIDSQVYQNTKNSTAVNLLEKPNYNNSSTLLKFKKANPTERMRHPKEMKINQLTNNSTNISSNSSLSSLNPLSPLILSRPLRFRDQTQSSHQNKPITQTKTKYSFGNKKTFLHGINYGSNLKQSERQPKNLIKIFRNEILIPRQQSSRRGTNYGKVHLRKSVTKNSVLKKKLTNSIRLKGDFTKKQLISTENSPAKNYYLTETSVQNKCSTLMKKRNYELVHDKLKHPVMPKSIVILEKIEDQKIIDCVRENGSINISEVQEFKFNGRPYRKAKENALVKIKRSLDI